MLFSLKNDLLFVLELCFCLVLYFQCAKISIISELSKFFSVLFTTNRQLVVQLVANEGRRENIDKASIDLCLVSLQQFLNNLFQRSQVIVDD